jgi:hypothetical protein
VPEPDVPGDRQHHHERRHSEADDDGSEDQRLGERIRIGGGAIRDDRRRADAQPPGREDEEVDRIRQQGEPE